MKKEHDEILNMLERQAWKLRDSMVGSLNTDSLTVRSILALGFTTHLSILFLQ